MKKPIFYGILGTSPISYTMAQAINASEHGRLYGIYGRNAEKTQDFAHDFGMKQFLSSDELLSDPNIDIVYLGLPNHLHKEFVIKAAVAKKHILCEKPFVLSETEALEAVNTIERSQVFCMEALMYRCHPFTAKLKQIVANKILGELCFINAFYSADIVHRANKTAGGSLLNLGCYPLSLVTHLVEEHPTTIVAQARLEEGADRHTSMLLRFPSGCQAAISSCDDMPMSFGFSIFGKKGHLMVRTNPWLPAEKTV